MFDSLRGKSVVVTGSSKGIGKGIATAFAKAGSNVLVVSRHLEEAEACARSLGKNASAVAGDVTRLESMERMTKPAAQRFGGIDVLCANAGIFPPNKLEEMTSAEWDHVVDTNLKGCFHSVKAAIPYLKKSSQGRVIITSSITGP